MIPEIWLPVNGFENKYEFSIFGRLRARPRKWSSKTYSTTGRLLQPFLNHAGYAIATLRVNKKNKKFVVHRLIAHNLIPNPANKPEINHRNGVKNDNHILNLEWATRMENLHHCQTVLKNHSHGEIHPKAKLTEADVFKIRSLHETGNYTYAEISRMYNMCDCTISNIVRKKIWKHLN